MLLCEGWGCCVRVGVVVLGLWFLLGCSCCCVRFGVGLVFGLGLLC